MYDGTRNLLCKYLFLPVTDLGDLSTTIFDFCKISQNRYPFFAYIFKFVILLQLRNRLRINILTFLWTA